MNAALEGLALLRDVKPHAKNFRPSILLMSGSLTKRSELIRLLSYLTDFSGVLVCGNVNVLHHRDLKFEKHLQVLHTWTVDREISESILESLGAHAFYQDSLSETFEDGFRSLCQLTGLGQLRSNILGLGFCSKWRKDSRRCEEYVNRLRVSLSLRIGILVARKWKKFQFKPKYQGTVDVWWFSDDGGLSLLLPHLLCCHPEWSEVTLRILTVSASGKDVALLYGLFKNLRIRAEIKPVDLKIDRRGWLVPDAESIQSFTRLVNDPESSNWIKKRETLQYLHLSELIRVHSSESNLVFVTMPVPRVGLSAKLYMGWLDILSSVETPCVFIRGNQETVLVYD